MNMSMGIAALETWIIDNRALLQLLGTASLVLLAVTVVALPIIVARLPEDYFTRSRRDRVAKRKARSRASSAGAFVKNLVGIVLILPASACSSCRGRELSPS